MKFKPCEESAIKFFEKESFFKSFLLFFSVIALFLAYILYDSWKDETRYLKSNILLEMKNYSLSFDDPRFRSRNVHKQKGQKFYTLYEDAQGLYILVPNQTPEAKDTLMIVTPQGSFIVPYQKDAKEVLKIWYPMASYRNDLHKIRMHLFGQALIFLLGAVIVALAAAWYALRPLRRSLTMMEDFIKDIVHDLNTPLSSIKLNLQIIDDRSDEIESIRTAAQTIEMLHHNLNAYLKEQTLPNERFRLREIIETYVAFFAPLYDNLTWEIEVDDTIVLDTDKRSFSRIIYNLIGNACKYNRTDGTITIRSEGTQLCLCNDSYGVKHPEKVFERFYKESERGLGIGLHIVDKLCRTLGIDKRFEVEGTTVVVTLDLRTVTAKPKTS